MMYEVYSAKVIDYKFNEQRKVIDHKFNEQRKVKN